MAELRQDQHHAEYMKLIGWRIERSAQGIRAYLRPLIFSASVMKIQRVPWDKLDFDWVKAIAKKNRVITTYIEVDQQVRQPVSKAKISDENLAALEPVITAMKREGFGTLSLGMVASKTQVVDLRQTEDQLLTRMKEKTRYNIGLAGRRKVQIKRWTGTALMNNLDLLNTYLKLIKQNNKRVGYWGGRESWIKAQLRAFGNQAYVVAAMDEHEIWLAAALFLKADKTSYYAHNGSTEKGRRDMAPSLVVWEGMKEAKRNGLEYLDFDGVFDERYPVKRWQGYTRFKSGFGGDYVWYPPAFVKWLTGWR